MIWGILLVAEKKKILYMVEAMGGGVFTYIVDLANELVDTYDMYIAYAVRKQTPANYKDYFDKRMAVIWILLILIWIYQNVLQGNNQIYPFTSELIGL